ncbi:fasciclin domain-containing protein, partial [Lutibacter sp. HS1-25]
MKNLKNLLSLFLIIFISVSIVSCDDDDDDDKMPVEMKNTVADFVVANQANYSSLLAALQKANLVETLKGTGPFTVFAPDNAAFSAFLANAGFANLDAVPVDA